MSRSDNTNPPRVKAERGETPTGGSYPRRTNKVYGREALWGYLDTLSHRIERQRARRALQRGDEPDPYRNDSDWNTY